MRRSWYWLLVVVLVAAATATLWPTRSAALVPQEPAGDGTAPFTLRIVFGQKDAAPTDWDGSVRIENGRIDTANGWRTTDRDAVSAGGWKLRTQSAAPVGPVTGADGPAGAQPAPAAARPGPAAARA